MASADRLIGGFSTAVYRFVDGIVSSGGIHAGKSGCGRNAESPVPAPDCRRLRHFELAQAGEIVQIADTETRPIAPLREIARARGFRSVLYVPLMSKGTAIGFIAVSRRTPARLPRITSNCCGPSPTRP